MADDRGPSGDARAILTVASCLSASVLAPVVVVTGQDRLDVAVTWVSVIEWPIENFVSPGDFVLTTGMGCDAEQLEALVEQSAHAGAAAVCLSVGVGAHHPVVPPAVQDCARRHGVVLLAIPWEVRFSDISRVLIDLLYVQRSHSGRAGDDLPSAFTRALLETGGVEGIAHALEGVTAMPSLILDVSGAVIGQGPLAADLTIAPPGGPNPLDPLRSRMNHSPPSSPRRIDVADGSFIVAAIVGRRQTLGWVVVVDHGGGGAVAADGVDEAVRHGATACAIELLRQEAAEEFGSRARGQFMWWATGSEAIGTDELAARSALLGYPSNARLQVALGLVEASDDGTASINVAADLTRRVRMRLQYPASVATHRESEILVCLDHREPDLASLLDEPALSQFSDRVSWGLAGGVHHLGDLFEAAAQARTAVAVTRATVGPGRLGRADDLGPFMLLSALASDPVAINLARRGRHAVGTGRRRTGFRSVGHAGGLPCGEWQRVLGGAAAASEPALVDLPAHPDRGADQT